MLAVRSLATALRSSNPSTSWHIADSADPPKQAFNLKPLKAGGLWLAVIITPPIARRALTRYETAGVGVGTDVSRKRKPLPSIISALRRANWSDKKRRS